MVSPAIQGGESVFADGFAVAERLRTLDHKAFHSLASVSSKYRSIDDSTGWHLEARGPLITATENGSSDITKRWGSVIGIRHNDLDRLPDLPPKGTSLDEYSGFYGELNHARTLWDEILASDEYRLVIDLQPGETMVVANQVSFT